ncbi:MAG: (2Fe-2S)-binding protein [Actinomycetota bacterium]
MIPVGSETNVTLRVNGEERSATIETRKNLADTLREDLGLTGTHLGCEHGVCGACTVLVDGQPARSCLMLAVSATDVEITTIEGLGTADEMHPVQRAMYERMSFQCAFCAPGFMMSAVALLDGDAEPTDEAIREELSGNLCRCTGYESIVRGVHRAAEILREERA